jgi:death-on-curing protein
MMQFDTGAVIEQHTVLIEAMGGLDGVRDMDLLDSAVSSTYQTSFGRDLYPTIYDKAAHLAFSLIKNHPFIDGNKRTGVTVMRSFLVENGMPFACTNDELVEFGLGIADSTLAKDEIKLWILNHCRGGNHA